MRTTIDIDDKLMRDVLKATGLKTKKDGEHFDGFIASQVNTDDTALPVKLYVQA